MKMVSIFLFFVIQIFAFTEEKTVLVFGGKTGWIGQRIVEILRNQGCNAVCATSRIENRQSIVDEIDNIKPDYIINAAGIIGKPNVDWCETHKQETIRTNITGTLNLADVAYMQNIHLTNISTGCIYEYDENHPIRSDIGFTEEEKPNFEGSFYSITKIRAEEFLLTYSNVLNLRMKMPVDDDLNSEKGFLNKIKMYKKIIDIPNSLCALWDLLPLAVDMTLKEIKGNYNFVNPGVISHTEILELYKEYIDPNHTYETFSVEEQDRMLKARRANAELSAKKLLLLYPDIPNIRDSILELFKNKNRKFLDKTIPLVSEKTSL